MFEAADIEQKLSKRTYERQVPGIRTALLGAQLELAERKTFAVLLIVAGFDGAGKGDVVNLLEGWMDPRHIRVRAFGVAGEEAAERPPMWRFWMAMPPRGKTGIFFGSWYSEPLLDRVAGRIGDNRLQSGVDTILRHEKMLEDEGVLLLKVWLHLSKKQQKARFRSLEKDPLSRWRVTRDDWKAHKHYDDIREVAGNVLRQTSTAGAPWMVVSAVDPHHRNLAVARLLLGAMRKRLEHKAARRGSAPVISVSSPGKSALLRKLDLSQKLDEEAYGEQRQKLQGELNVLSRRKKFAKRSLVLAFEGWDAAGKGSSIRRITQALDARLYDVIAIGAPTEEERAQPYLWRFWRRVPGLGRVAIFDRTWYGRVLVERVEKLFAPADWARAYSEINDFEQQLVSRGAIVVKFWLQVSPEEQLRRFKARQTTAYKRHKITPDDWRNRQKWEQYEKAVCDMVERTSTDIAPWALVAAEDKPFARIRILETVVGRLRDAL